MFEELAIYNDTLPMAQYQTILDLETLFNKIGYTDHQQKLVGLKGDYEVPDSDKGSELVTIYQEAMDLIYEGPLNIDLNEDDDLSFTDQATILITIFDLEDTDNLDVVNEALLSIDGLTDEETLATVLQAVNPKPNGWYEEHLEYVPASFIVRLKDLGAHPDIMEETIEQTERVKKEFLAFESTQGLIYTKVTEIGTLPIAWSIVHTTLATYLDGVTPVEFARQLYAGCIAADIPFKEREEKGIALIQNLFEDEGKEAAVHDAYIQIIDSEVARHADDAS